MPATALRVEEPTFRECVITYTTALCRRCGIRLVEIDDVVQDALLAIHRASFDSSKGDFGTWWRAIVWKVVRKHVQAAQQYALRFSDFHPDIDEHPAPDPSPERCARREQARCALSNALETISAQHADVFVLHVIEKLTHREIGEKLDISASNSEKCFQRARDDLRQCLGDNVFAAMPLDVVGCNEPAASNKGHSRWNEWAHYSGQVAALIVALLLYSPSNPPPTLASVSSKIRTIALTYNDAMYRIDKLPSVYDERTVLRDAPSGKPEPASLPSVRIVSTPTSVDDKPTPSQPRTSLPSYTYKYKAEFSAHRRGNIR